MKVMSTRSALATIITVAAILVLVLAFARISEASFNDAKPLTREAVYIGGATIIALAVFGSILSTGIMTGQGKKLDESELNLVYGGAAAIIITQVLNMLLACCLPFSVILLGAFTLVTIIGTVMIVLGFARVVERQRSGSKGLDGGQPPAQNGKPDDRDPKTKQGEEQPSAQDCASTDLQFRFRSGRAACHSPDSTASAGQPD